MNLIIKEGYMINNMSVVAFRDIKTLRNNTSINRDKRFRICLKGKRYMSRNISGIV
jgi:hypothetical protein